jgi:hypothetical protein
MFDLGYSRARNITSIVATPLLFAVSIAHAQNSVPITPDTDGWSGRGPKTLQSDLRRIRTSAYPDGDAGREIVPRSHHDRIF